MANREREIEKALRIIRKSQGQIGTRGDRIHQGAQVDWEARKLALGDESGCGGCVSLKIEFDFDSRCGREIVRLRCRSNQEILGLYRPFVFRLGERPGCTFRSPFLIQEQRKIA